MEAARLSSGSPAMYTVPHSIEAEQAGLGAMLLNREAVAIASEILRVEDFYYEPHRQIYEAILTLYNRGDPVDLLTTAEELKRKDRLDFCGGQAYLLKLMEMVPSIANVADYCRIVEEKAILRTLIQVAHQIIDWAYHHDGDLESLIDRAEGALFRVGQRRIAGQFQPLTDLIKQTYDFLEQRSRTPGVLMGIPTGFTELDELLGGLHPSDLIILAGRPSMGKTAFALSIATNVALHQQLPVAIFCLEMSKQQLVQRLLCALARVNLHRLRTGYMREPDYVRLAEASHQLYNAPIFLDDTPDLSPFEIRGKARRLKASEGLGLIIIDYLQLVRSPRQRENKVQEVTEVVRSLKSLARELDVPVIALSQLSRSVEHRESKRPLLADLRESGAIEAEADVVAFLYRPDYYERARKKTTEPSPLPQEEDSRPEQFVTEVIIAKNRNGPVTTVEVAFIPRYATFENLTRPPTQPF